MINWEIVGSRIRKIRGAQTQEEFGAKLGVTKQYISAVETGKQKPSIELLYGISEEYSVSLDYLLLGASKQPVNSHLRYPEAAHSELLTRLARTLDILWCLALQSDEENQTWLLIQLIRAVPEVIE